MLNLKKLLTKTLEQLQANNITYQDYTVTSGTTAYQGYYYAQFGNVVSGKTLIGCLVLNVDENRPAFCVQATSSTMRVYTNASDKTITVRCIYRGGGYCLTVFSRLSAVLGRSFARLGVA